MPLVAVMVAGPGLQELAREQIGTIATVRFCDTAESLIELVKAGGVDAVVGDVRDITGASVLPTLGAIRRQAPYLPLILYCLPTPAVLREIPDIIAVTRGLNVVLRNWEHLGLALRPMLRPPRVPSAGETLVRHLVPVVPGPFRSFLLVSALKASPGQRLTPQPFGVASRAGRLSARCIVLVCRAPASFWGHARHSMPHGGSTCRDGRPNRSSPRCGSPIVSSIVRVLRRYFDCSIRSLREEGGFQELLHRFETSLLGGPPPGRRQSA